MRGYLDIDLPQTRDMFEEIVNAMVSGEDPGIVRKMRGFPEVVDYFTCDMDNRPTSYNVIAKLAMYYHKTNHVGRLWDPEHAEFAKIALRYFEPEHFMRYTLCTQKTC